MIELSYKKVDRRYFAYIWAQGYLVKIFSIE